MHDCPYNASKQLQAFEGTVDGAVGHVRDLRHRDEAQVEDNQEDVKLEQPLEEAEIGEHSRAVMPTNLLQCPVPQRQVPFAGRHIQPPPVHRLDTTEAPRKH